MAFIRQYVMPLLIVLTFAFALLVVSARIFLADDLAAPAPVSVEAAPDPQAALPPALARWLPGSVA